MALGVMIPETATLKPVVWQRDMEYLRSRLPIVPETASLLAPSIDLSLPSTIKRSSKISSAKRSSVSTSSSNPRSSFIGSRDLASRSSHRSEGRPSFLLDLPVEIRHQILRYLLPCHNGSRYYRVYTDCDTTIVGPTYNRGPTPPTTTTTHQGTHFLRPPNCRKKKPHKHPLAVMRLNRQLYVECLGIVYSEKLFHFVGTAYLPVLEFFRRLSPDAREMVRKVRLTLLKPGADGQPSSIGTGFGGALTKAGLDRLCQEIHDQLPGLEVLKSDPWVWM